MIQKNTIVYPIDKSGAVICNTFHVYRGGSIKPANVGNLIKVSIRKVKPDIKLKKKSKSRALVVRSCFIAKQTDGSHFMYYENSVILIKRRLVTRSKEFIGPADRHILRKKLLYKFTGIL